MGRPVPSFRDRQHRQAHLPPVQLQANDEPHLKARQMAPQVPLSIKYTFADFAKPFRIHYATIKRDSGLLNEYSRERAAIEAVQKALDDLKEKGVLSSFERSDV